jgi:hypothetical protein
MCLNTAGPRPNVLHEWVNEVHKGSYYQWFIFWVAVASVTCALPLQIMKTHKSFPTCVDFDAGVTSMQCASMQHNATQFAAVQFSAIQPKQHQGNVVQLAAIQ